MNKKEKVNILDTIYSPSANNIGYEKLPPAFKEDWVESLRSGKYEQITGMLYSKEKECFCVLGVAGEVCSVPRTTLSKYSDLFDLKTTKKIPKELKKNEKLQNHMIELNDTHKFTFNQLADWIEKYL